MGRLVGPDGRVQRAYPLGIHGGEPSLGRPSGRFPVPGRTVLGQADHQNRLARPAAPDDGNGAEPRDMTRDVVDDTHSWYEV